MVRFKKIIHNVRIIGIIMQFIFLFLMLNTLLHLKPMFYIFLVIYSAYIINTIIELLSKSESYKNDLIYNLMQVGMSFYFMILFYRIYFFSISVNDLTMTYFNMNFGVISVLLIFMLIYSRFELRLDN